MLKRDGILNSVLTTHQFVWEILLWYYIGFIYNILKRFSKLIYYHVFKPLISGSNYISDLYSRYTASIDMGGKLKANASQKRPMSMYSLFCSSTEISNISDNSFSNVTCISNSKRSTKLFNSIFTFEVDDVE